MILCVDGLFSFASLFEIVYLSSFSYLNDSPFKDFYVSFLFQLTFESWTADRSI